MNLRKLPLLSVIIPTRERFETLQYTVQTTLGHDWDDLEVLVSDNVSEDGTKNCIRSIADSRLRYIETNERLSMCDNWEFAVCQSRGRYVMVIGDDDALVPQAVQSLATNLAKGAHDVVTWPLHTYCWPVGKHRSATARISPVKGESEVALRQLGRYVMGVGGWRYYDLPSIYHSAVRRDALDVLRSRCGRLFPSTQPDVFVAMSLPAVSDWALNLGQPLTVSGHSAKANSGKWFTKEGTANLERYIGEFGEYYPHRTLWNTANRLAVLIPDSMLLAKELFPEVYGDVDFNYSAMYAFLWRLRLVSLWAILRNRKAIQGRCPFRLAEFSRFLAVHFIARLRREGLTKRRGGKADARNILEFVRTLPS